jgi:REP element-mobilizing transposase RayT
MSPVQSRPHDPTDDDPSLNRRFYLPRLPRSLYQSHAVVHWTLTMHDQSKGWLTETLHQVFRELMLHTAAREGLLCPVYCLMPDHMHLIWMGLKPTTDQRRAMAFLRTHLKRALAPARMQHQAHDHVLREDERKQTAFANGCSYILNNPVEAGLVKEAADWEFSGCVVPGYPTLRPLEVSFWEVFWGVYWKLRQGEKR